MINVALPFVKIEYCSSVNIPPLGIFVASITSTELFLSSSITIALTNLINSQPIAIRPQSDFTTIPLSAEMKELLKTHILICTGDWNSLHNPVFFPTSTTGTGGYFHGLVYGTKTSDFSTQLKPYRFNDSLFQLWTDIIGYGTDMVIKSINGKSLPTIPSDASNKTYNIKLVNGTWTFVEEV